MIRRPQLYRNGVAAEGRFERTARQVRMVFGPIQLMVVPDDEFAWLVRKLHRKYTRYVSKNNEYL